MKALFHNITNTVPDLTLDEDELKSESASKVSKLAIYMLGCNFISMIDCLEHGIEFDASNIQKYTTLVPENTFTWDLQLYTARLKPQTSCVIVLNNFFNEKWLDNFKFRKDFIELKRVTLALVQNYLQNSEDFASKAMMKSLVKCVKFNDDLIKEYNLNVKLHADLLGGTRAYDFLQHSKKQKTLSYSTTHNEFLEKVLNYKIKEPYEYRYVKGYLASLVDQEEHKFSLKEKEIHAEIQRLQDRIKENEFAHGCMMSVYYISIDSYRRNIEYWENKYDKAFAKIHDSISMKKNLVTSLYNKRQELQREYEHLTTNIQSVKELIAAEEELALIQAALIEAAEAEKAEAQAKRKKRVKKVKKKF